MTFRVYREGRLKIWRYWNKLDEPEIFVITESPAPAPPNGDLVQIGNVWSIGIPDNPDADRSIGFDIKLPEEHIGGLDITQMKLYGWNTENRTWDSIPGASPGITEFTASIWTVKHTSYALFAPRSEDTIPPDPMTDFEPGTTDSAEKLVRLRWTAPADNMAVYRYDIRYNSVPVTDSNWDDCARVTVSVPRPAEPGIFQTMEARHSDRQ